MWGLCVLIINIHYLLSGAGTFTWGFFSLWNSSLFGEDYRRWRMSEETEYGSKESTQVWEASCKLML